MRIIHFSDIHAAGWLKSIGSYFDKRLLGVLNFYLRHRWQYNWENVAFAVEKIKTLSPDIVICTGDLTTISDPSEFEQAKDSLRPLIDDTSFDLIYVPGNHDYYVHDPRCTKAMKAVFNVLNRDRWSFEDLPVKFDVGIFRFLILNQAVPVAPYMSSGAMDNRTIKWVQQQISANVTTQSHHLILVSHFPLFDATGKSLSPRRRCTNNSVLQRAYRNGHLRVSLCGHVHEGFTRSDAHDTLEVCAGSLTRTALINMLEFDYNKNKFQQEWINVEPKLF